MNLNDSAAAALFSSDPNNAMKLTAAEFRTRIARNDEPDYHALSDAELSAFLDGLVAKLRGVRAPDASRPALSDTLTKNDILKKLRIAFSLRDDQLLTLLKAGGSSLTKSELSAFFRAPDHKHYRSCGNQVLRALLNGLTQTVQKTPPKI